jgi:hypothetical protein
VSAAGRDHAELDGQLTAAGVDVGAAVDRQSSRGSTPTIPGSAASLVGAGPFSSRPQRVAEVLLKAVL